MQSCDKQMWSFWPFWEEMSKKDICLNIQFLCIVNAQYSNDLKSIAGTCTCSIYNVLYGNLWKSPRYFLWQVYSERYVDQMGIIGYFPATVVKKTHTFVQDTVQIPTAVSIFVSFLEDNVFLFLLSGCQHLSHFIYSGDGLLLWLRRDRPKARLSSQVLLLVTLESRQLFSQAGVSDYVTLHPLVLSPVGMKTWTRSVLLCPQSDTPYCWVSLSFLSFLVLKIHFAQ